MKLARIVFFLVLTMLANASEAATHTITFPGFAYSPGTLQVAVGDVIVWSGDFTTHPLKSDVIPPGAVPFEKSEGSTFSYTVMVAGSYSYYCTAHGGPGGQGMSGTFTASDAGVDDNPIETVLQLRAYPNPTATNLTLSFTLEKSSNVRIGLFDINGRELYQIENGCAAGENTTYVNVATLPIGSYYYRIETSDAMLTRKFTVSR